MAKKRRLESLTPEQVAQLPAIRDRWLAIGLSTEPANRYAAEAAADLAYATAGLPAPRLRIWLDSPLAGAYGAAFLCALQRSAPQVGAQVGAQVWDQVWDQVGAQVRDQVLDQVWDQVRAQVRAQVGAQVGDQVWRCGYGFHDASWVGFYDTIASFGLHELVKPLDGIQGLTRACGWWWPFAGAIVFTARPNRLRRDAQGRLHSDDGQAVGYPDGWGVYAWHGVRVPERVITHPAHITVAQIHQEANAEIRRVLLERYGYERFLADSGAQVLHADDYGTLYRTEFPDDEPLVCVSVVNSTPEADGSSKQYVLRVPPTITSAREAVAWSFQMTAQEYAPEAET